MEEAPLPKNPASPPSEKLGFRLDKAAKQEINKWLCTVVIGFLVGKCGLEKACEPSALRLVAGWQGYKPHKADIAVFDVSALYNWFPTTDGILDTSRLGVFLKALEKLPSEVRPKAIGFDVAAIQRDEKLARARPDASPVYMIPAPHSEFLRALETFEDGQQRLVEDDRIKIRIGCATQFKPRLSDYHAGDLPQVDRMWASVSSFREPDRAPLFYPGKRSIDLLGYAVVKDSLGTPAGEIPQVKSPDVEPPSDWPPELPAPRCIFVNYQVLHVQDGFTFSVPDRQRDKADWNVDNVFGKDAINRLRNLGSPKMWFVGVARGLNDEDTVSVDMPSYAATDAKAVRGIYQHVAVADSILYSPIHKLSTLAEIAFDLGFSLVGLGLVLHRKQAYQWPSDASWRIAYKAPLWLLSSWPTVLAAIYVWVRRKPALQKKWPYDDKDSDDLMERWGKVVLAAVPLALAWGMARHGWYWIGFVSVWVYLLLESFVEQHVQQKEHVRTDELKAGGADEANAKNP